MEKIAKFSRTSLHIINRKRCCCGESWHVKSHINKVKEVSNKNQNNMSPRDFAKKLTEFPVAYKTNERILNVNGKPLFMSDQKVGI